MLYIKLKSQKVSSRPKIRPVMNQYLQKCSAKITSGVCIMAANKVINSALSSPISDAKGPLEIQFIITTERTNFLQQLPSRYLGFKIGIKKKSKKLYNLMDR